MEIILAKSAGFCFGVKRAVDCVYERIKNGKIYTYGPIIHNKEVTRDLEKYGVEIIDDVLKADNGEVIIRSHGVGPEVYSSLEDADISFTDCTCPFVKKIHNIVSENYNNGKKIIIVGNAEHPEVIGINGWCENSAIIINSIDEARELILEGEEKYSLVVQTTFQTKVFLQILEIIKDKADIEVFNTICSATADRQKEAEMIAKVVDAMIILGDKNSSNTRKLYEISSKFCKKTFLCETISDLQLKFISSCGKIGITAGASTPPVIIKEAVKVMSEQEKNFEEMINDSMVTLRSGTCVKGTVIRVSESGEVFVNLGYKSDGIIPKAEYSDDPNVDPASELNEGDEIEVFVKQVNDGEGNVLLSKKAVDATKGFEEIEAASENGTVVKGKVIEVVKGGLIALMGGIRAFVPSSQISNRYVEDLSQFIGNEYDFEIIEFDRMKRRIVAGRKALAQKEFEESKKKVFDSINAGDRIDGTVSRIVDFGAFVDLGGVDGLIHISEMSWGRVKKVTDVLAEGDAVKVTVLDVDKEKGKISLSLKDISNDPWNGAAEKYAIGNVVSGKVVRMVPFGAFVELEEGVDGLVHISQISYKHVVKPEDELTIGDVINAKVTDLDLDNKKISLSIKETLEPPKAEEASAEEASVEEAPAVEEASVEEASEE